MSYRDDVKLPRMYVGFEGVIYVAPTHATPGPALLGTPNGLAIAFLVSCVGHYHLHVVSPTANTMYGKARVWDWLNAALEDYFGAGDWHAAAVLKRISIVGEYPPPTVILDRDALKNMGGARAFLALAMSPC